MKKGNTFENIRLCNGCSLFSRGDECSIRWKTFFDKNGGAGHECWYPEGAIPAEAEAEEVEIEGRPDKRPRNK